MNLLVLNGSPIVVFKTEFKLSAEEKTFIQNLDMHKSEKNASVTKDVSIFKHTQLERIKKILNKHVEEYKNNTLEIEDCIKVVQSWVTKNDNSVHCVHKHRNAFISAVFYLENEGDNKISFITDKSSLETCQFLDYKIKNNNIFNSSTWTLEIEEGMIVVFLSDLSHQSINKGTKTMVGANYFLTGEIGSEEKVTQLTIG
jgi:hypothetical protein